jgi:hypothetical protein
VTIISVEDAYSYLAEAMINACGESAWTGMVLKAQIYSGMVSSEFSIISANSVDETKYVKAISEAVRFLRDDLLATTGDRIWGLTFTLYPDGKFKIEYDYNKPEGYEETDETISLEEALKGLPGQSA